MAARILTQTTSSSSSSSKTLARIFHLSSPLDRSPAAATTSECHRALHSIASHHLRPSDPRFTAPGSIIRPDLARPTSPVIDSAISDSLVSGKIWGCDHFSLYRSHKIPHASMQAFPRWFCKKALGGCMMHQADNAHSKLDLSTGKNKMSMALNCSNGDEGKCPQVISFSPLEATLTRERVSGLGSESLKIKRNELSQKITYALIPALLVVSKTKLTTSLLLVSVFWQIYGFCKEIFLDYVHQEVTRKWVLIYFKLLLLIVAKDVFLWL